MRQLFLVNILVTAFFIASCSPPPARVLGGAENSDDGTGVFPVGEPDPDDPTQPKTPSKQPSAIDLKVTRDTLGKILQAAGGEQDAECQNKASTSKTQLRLLTSDEYQNTIKDILKVTSDFRAGLPSEITVFGFRNNADSGLISDAHASAYVDTSIAVAEEIKINLQTLVACQESAGAVCAQKVIDVLAPQLWRRPLEASEKTGLLKLYNVGLAASATEGMTLLISDILMSPHFLYRSEIGKNGALNAFELASALSYFFWGTSPDATLQSLAASGELSKETTLLAQANRLLVSPRSRYASTEFANAWLDARSVLGANKETALYPNFTAEIRTAMANEAENTFDFLMRQPAGKFESLFTADFSIGDEKLAAYYKGQASVEAGVSKIKFASTPRKGVLGLGAVLSHLATPKETHPIKRGDFVLKNMLCSIPEPTPKGLAVEVPPAAPGLTTRERFAAHKVNVVCANCHIAIDGIGFGMEDFDGAAIYRETDNGKKIDNSGELVAIDGMNTKFNGVGELSSYLATSSQAKRCFVVEWYRLAHGYSERPADICAIRDIANSFEKGTMTLGQLLVQIVTHPSYAKKD